MTPIRILLADDHTLLRQGLRRILEAEPELEIAAEAASGLEAVELARQLQPDVVLIDIGMPELNGIEATAQILRHSPRSAVLILSMHKDERYVRRAVRVGARGYLLKDTLDEDLIQAIRQVQQGRHVFSPVLVGLVDGETAAVEDRYELLTDRERQVYQLLAEGNSNKDVAGRLHLSLHTVETHRMRIMEKLDVHTSAELVLSAVRRGLVS